MELALYFFVSRDIIDLSKPIFFGGKSCFGGKNMPSKSDTLFWKKKEFISFLLSILVLFIHTYYVQDVVSQRLISVFNHKVSYFFSRSVTQFAVPMFFILSGITFYKDYNNKKYFSKIKSRVFTLVCPYLIWNTIWMLWEIFKSYVAGSFGNGEQYPLNFVSVVKGIFFYNCNVPFWFVFDLIVFSFAAPLIFFIIKNKYVGIGSVVLLSVLSLFGVYLPESVFFYPMAIVFYLIGAVIGYHFFDFAVKESSKPVQTASLVFLSAYILAKNIVPSEMHLDNYFIQTVVFTLAAFSLWNVADLFIRRLKPRAIYRRSFAVYAMHLNVSMIVHKILSFCIPQNEWLEIPRFIIVILLTLVIINFVCAFLEKFLPRIYAVLMGSRMKTTKQ